MTISDARVAVEEYLKKNERSMDWKERKAFSQLFSFYGIKVNTEYIHTKRKAAFPENLVQELEVDIDGKLNKDQMKGLAYVMDNFISEKEREVLFHRYRDGVTLDKIGEMYGVSRERARQLVKGAIRKMKNPARTDYIKEGYYATNEYREASDRFKKETERLNGLIMELKEDQDLLAEVLNNAADRNGLMRAQKTMENKLDELELSTDYLDLSVRSYNCLKRGGYKRLRDFVGLKYSDLAKIRNLGTKSLYEIIGALEKYGVILEDDL